MSREANVFVRDAAFADELRVELLADDRVGLASGRRRSTGRVGRDWRRR